MNPFRTLSLTLLLASTPLIGAEKLIRLKPEDFTRLGIGFAAAKSGAEGSGARFPATVIASPEGVATLTALQPGVIEKWFVAPGDRVRAGQALVLLRSAEALRLQQEWMASVAASETAEVELKKAERLLSEGIVSTQRVALARRSREQAVFSRRAAEAVLQRIGFTPERLTALRESGEGLGTYQVVAPSAGTVARRGGAIGDLVEGREALVNLRGAGPNWVSVQIPARLVVGLQTGGTIKMLPSGEELVLRQLDHGVDDRSQTVRLLAEFKSETAHLPGQIVSIELPSPQSGILVPAAAVVHTGNETTVFVRGAEGIEARVVSLLPIGADYVATAGLKSGEELVVRGAAILKGINAGFGHVE